MTVGQNAESNLESVQARIFNKLESRQNDYRLILRTTEQFGPAHS
jgi:hypothetical protein